MYIYLGKVDVESIRDDGDLCIWRSASLCVHFPFPVVSAAFPSWSFIGSLLEEVLHWILVTQALRVQLDSRHLNASSVENGNVQR